MIHGQLKNGKEEKCYSDVIQQVCEVENLRQQVSIVSNPVSPARQRRCDQFKPHYTALVTILGNNVPNFCNSLQAVQSRWSQLCTLVPEGHCPGGPFYLCLPCLPHRAPQWGASWNRKAAGLKESTSFFAVYITVRTIINLIN